MWAFVCTVYIILIDVYHRRWGSTCSFLLSSFLLLSMRYVRYVMEFNASCVYGFPYCCGDIREGIDFLALCACYI